MTIPCDLTPSARRRRAHHRSRLVGCILALWAAALAAGDTVEALSAAFDHAPLTVITTGQCVHFTAYEAETDAQLQRGLMHVTALPRLTGMLFRFPPDRQPAMWMRNTYIPLDMLFIAADGTVVHVAADAVPHSLETITTDIPSRYVLEINGGLAAELGIEPGARVQHRWLP